MSEFIDREAVNAALSAECSQMVAAYLINAVEAIPAADVRPVVLCRDCRHWEYDAIFFDGWCRGRQQGNPNWYCADGEKREES